MKAITIPKYGSPDVLELKEVEKPTPKDDEILIRVHASAVNPADKFRMRGKPFLVRLSDGLFKPKNPILGADTAGRVEAVGSKVKLFKPGDEVFGELSAGGFAEYACGKENQLALKPANVSFAQAAAVPLAGLTAWQGLQKIGEIKAGQTVLVNGASGGVGTFAVQIAKALGAEVTGVCSTRNLEMVQSIGADHVVDYSQQDFTQMGKRYDIVYDAVGNISVKGFKQILTAKGRGVLIGFQSMGKLLGTIIGGKFASKKNGIKIASLTASPNREDLDALAALLESGKVVPVIDRQYGYAETADAIRYIETGRASGKVVIDWEVR